MGTDFHGEREVLDLIGKHDETSFINYLEITVSSTQFILFKAVYLRVLSLLLHRYEKYCECYHIMRFLCNASQAEAIRLYGGCI